jgi:TolB protein
MLTVLIAVAQAVSLTASGLGGQALVSEPMARPALVCSIDRGGHSSIYHLDRDGRLRKLSRGTAADYGAVWSPRGDRLAFVSSRDGHDNIYVMHPDGSGVHRLTHDSTASNGAPAASQAPTWSPDGKRIAFTSTRDGGEAKIYRMDADGSHQVRLTRTPTFVIDAVPDWSPDGRYIIFTSNRQGFDNNQIFRMRPDGSDVTRLTNSPSGVDDGVPDYAPDGRLIVFSSTRNGGWQRLFTMHSDGSAVLPLGGPMNLDEVFPRWTAQGQDVVFETFPGFGGAPPAGVWVIHSDGTQLRRLTPRSVTAFAPDPDPLAAHPTFG